MKYSIKEKINMDIDKYHFIFGFENIVLVFRRKDVLNISECSEDFKVIYTYEHNCYTVEDVLLDLNISSQIGNKELIVNDVVGIKINGFVSCYQYLGSKRDRNSAMEGYREISSFINVEKENTIKTLHKENKVISILDGTVFPIEELEHKKYILYAIDGEIFKPNANRFNGFSTTDYSLYCLEKTEILNINPYRRPFFNISVALYYFLNNKVSCRKKQSLLLLNRQELYMVRDFFQLNELIG